MKLEYFQSVINNLYELTSFHGVKRAKACMEVLEKNGSETSWQEYMSMEHIFYKHVRVEIKTTKRQLLKLLKTGHLPVTSTKKEPLFNSVKSTVIGEVKLDDIQEPYRIRLANSVAFTQGLFFVKRPNEYGSVTEFLRDCCTWDDLGGLGIAQAFDIVDGNSIKVALLLEEPFIRGGDVVEVSIPNSPQLDDFWYGLIEMGITVTKI